MATSLEVYKRKELQAYVHSFSSGSVAVIEITLRLPKQYRDSEAASCDLCCRKCCMSVQAHTPLSVLSQTWKVVSQQCESYGWEEGFTGISMG
ncbi:hypothetical protein AVEN_174411-1 [Araneus ventricosus]|uniref:Uncharacterized protein n=1 Tax=Araneus ventricosus TaxID=182803 RepID=A0A4Y2H3U0_ARAVE|nr:hypothetical protein AVEN_174411-1 [Araneus ventricosus]